MNYGICIADVLLSKLFRGKNTGLEAFVANHYIFKATTSLT